MRYFLVIGKRGHCGRGNFIEIGFAIKANHMIEAMDKAKKMPAVKHTQSILQAKEITLAEYQEYRTVSAYKRLTGIR